MWQCQRCKWRDRLSLRSWSTGGQQCQSCTLAHASLLCKCSLTGPLHIFSKLLSLRVCAACSEYITSVMLHLSRVCWMPPNFFSQCARFLESAVTRCDLYEIKKKTMIQAPKFTRPTSLACDQSPASNLTNSCSYFS